MLAYQKSLKVLMKKRRSCRNFSDKVVNDTSIELLQNACKNLCTSHYSYEVEYSNRFKKQYLIGISNSKDKHYLDFAYRFEELVLYCTELGLQTCWTGVFPTNHFHSLCTQSSFHSVDIVSPIGYCSREPTEKYRKPWNEVFFNNTTMNPLDKKQVSLFADSLEMVRIAPSAMNLQPWRVLYDKKSFHFCLARSSGIIGFGMKKSRVDFQMIDMGIAISHFDLMNKENHIQGQWMKVSDITIHPQWDYVVSFIF